MRRLLALTLAGILSTNCHERYDTGEKIIEPSEYDANLGEFIILPSGEIRYLCPDCTEVTDVTLALKKMGIYEFIEGRTDKPFYIFSKWDRNDSSYNLREGWAVLNCIDTNSLSAFVMVFNPDETDSSEYMSCVYYTELFECSGYDKPECTLVE